jgi:RNA polymerase sigma-70 factor (ECF subfamily)
MEQKTPDSTLLERIRAGDKSACAECITAYSAGIYRLALRLMRNEADAEEVTQETFLSAFRGIGRFGGRADLKTWLYRIAYNAALMRLRKRNPETVPIEEAADPDDGGIVPRALHEWRDLPEEELEQAEVRRELERAVGGLPENLRAVFMLRDLENASTEETAAALGISADLVKTRLHRARLRLRERLAGYFGAEGNGNHET